jgi:hypothetical protein
LGNEVWRLGGFEKTTRLTKKNNKTHQANTENAKKMVVQENKKEMDNY